MRAKRRQHSSAAILDRVCARRPVGLKSGRRHGRSGRTKTPGCQRAGSLADLDRVAAASREHRPRNCANEHFTPRPVGVRRSRDRHVGVRAHGSLRWRRTRPRSHAGIGVRRLWHAPGSALAASAEALPPSRRRDGRERCYRLYYLPLAPAMAGGRPDTTTHPARLPHRSRLARGAAHLEPRSPSMRRPASFSMRWPVLTGAGEPGLHRNHEPPARPLEEATSGE